MKSLTGLLLVGLLALWIDLPSTASFRMPFVVPGICPRNPFPCSLPGFDRCRSDYECPRNQKCCSYRCGRACRVTQVIRSSCSRIPGWCTVPGIDRCSSDYDCPGRKRCCYYNCARTCRLL